MHAALEWQDEPPAIPEQPELKELKPEQTDSVADVELEESSVEKADNISNNLPGPSTEDFVNVEKEADEKYSADSDSVARRRKGKKKKN